MFIAECLHCLFAAVSSQKHISRFRYRDTVGILSQCYLPSLSRTWLCLQRLGLQRKLSGGVTKGRTTQTPMILSSRSARTGTRLRVRLAIQRRTTRLEQVYVSPRTSSTTFATSLSGKRLVAKTNMEVRIGVPFDGCQLADKTKQAATKISTAPTLKRTLLSVATRCVSWAQPRSHGS